MARKILARKPKLAEPSPCILFQPDSAPEPGGFGVYAERSNEFKSGEKLVTYAEPVGYGWKELGKAQTYVAARG